MTELERRARAYIKAKCAQELDHTDPDLNAKRTEIHDAFIMQLDIDGSKYETREDATRIALDVVNGEERESMEYKRCAHCRRRYLWRNSWESNLCPRCNRLLESAQSAEASGAQHGQPASTQVAQLEETSDGQI